MRILQVSTFDISGGAAKSGYRLHRGLLQLGDESRMLVRHKLSTDDSVFAVDPVKLEETFDEELFLGTVVQGHYINSHRTDISNTLFSLPYPGYDLSTLPLVQAADVINLHWVAYYQSPITLHRLLNLGVPVVWTLHDHWPFTGGCHVPTGCDNYREDCRACPQLADDPFDLPKAVLGDKLALLPGESLTIVAPSRWLATRASGSRLFKDTHVRVIPNSVETDLYRPLPKAQARESLGLPAESVVLLFGATDVREKLKGFRELQDATQYCLAHPEFERLVESEKITLLCFGHGSDELKVGRIPVFSLGYVTSDKRMASAYAAADIFVLPSLEDNLPNTMLEAMSCGVPVVAFDAGGIPEVVVNDVTGQLAAVGDARRLGEAILSLIFDPSRREAMGENCRKAMLDGYTLDVQALRYKELYGDLRNGRQPRARRTSWDSAMEQDQQQSVGETTTADTLPVRLETGLGPRFEGIYEHVLSKALREFASAREKAYMVSEADRASRLEVIHEQGGRLGELEAERNDLQSQLTDLRKQFEGADADRAERLRIIREQGRRLGELEGERNDLRAQLGDVSLQFESVEADRAARLEIVREQGRRLGELEGERNDLRAQLDELHQRFEAVEADRAAWLEVIQTLEGRLQEVEQTLRGISRSRTYRLLRRFGRWAQLERTVTQLTRGAGSAGPQAGNVAPVDYYSAIREPKRLGSVRYDPQIINNIVEDLQAFGYEVQPYRIDVADYRAYFHRAGYEDRCPDHYKFNLPEEPLEHYVAAQLLELRTSDVYIEIGSEGSAAPEIYARLFGCTSYRQDQAYPEGFKGDTIGSDAANMPIPDAFATKMALHCSFEHFEGDSDIRFVKEVNRVLQPGGAVCIVPLYLLDHYVILTDPTVSVPQEVEFEDDATIYCDPTWGNRHARFYDAAHLMERVYSHLNGMTMKIYRITNAKEVDASCYMEFAALITKP